MISVFASGKNYIQNTISKHAIEAKYIKDDLSQVNSQLYEWLATINDKSSSNDRISQTEQNINTSTQKNQSRSNADYLSAVERGDMKTAQRMVDEAAERAFAKSKIRLPDKNKTAIASMMFEKIP